MSIADIFEAADTHLTKDTKDFLAHPEIIEIEASIERLQALAFRLVKEVETSADDTFDKFDSARRRAVAIFNKAQTDGDYIPTAEIEARKEAIALQNENIVQSLKRDVEDLVVRHYDNPAHAEKLANELIAMDIAEIDRLSVDFAVWTKHHCKLAWTEAVKRLEELANLVDA